MAEGEKSGETTSAAVYVPFTTFNNALSQIAKGVPNRIDRTVFPGQSGAVQSQLIAGLKFLGLIDDDGRPQPALNVVAVDDERARKLALKKILEDRYKALFALDLTRTTPAEFNERMGATYKVSGDTLKKAGRFFLAAAAYAEIPVSPYLAKTQRAAGSNGNSGRKRRAVKSKESPVPPPPPTTHAEPHTGGTARTVTLRSGGTLTLSATIDVLQLKGKDRNFVFGIIDQFDAYESDEAGS